MTRSAKLTRRYLLVVAVLSVHTASAAVLCADTVNNTGGLIAYDLSFSGSQPLLENPNDPMTMKMSGWNTPQAKEIMRKRPWFELENTSQQADLTLFEMTIGDTAYHFDENYDWMSSFTAPQGVGYNVSFVGGGDLLRIAFTNFNPGDIVQFQMDIDLDGTDDTPPYPDFRLVMFTANGNNTGTNSMVKTMFEDPLSGNQGQLWTTMPDYPVNYFIPNGAFHNYLDMDPMNVFNLAQAIPEPSSYLLWLFSGIALIAFCYRHRRRGQQPSSSVRT